MKIFKLLYEKPCSLSEIIDELYRENIVVTKETLVKYFKTIRQSGCILRKKQGKFYLESIPFTLNLSDCDYDNIEIFANLGVGLYGDNVKASLKDAIKKILSMTDKGVYEKYISLFSKSEKDIQEPFIYKEKIAKLLKYGRDNAKIKILYNDEKILISHISFKYIDDNVYLHAFNEIIKNYELYLLKDIKEIYSTPEVSTQCVFAPYTVFEISGRLMRTYTLYEGERVIKVKNDSIVISNNLEDKNQLYRRLVRYGTLCKIISTGNDIAKFNEMLDKMRANLLGEQTS